VAGDPLLFGVLLGAHVLAGLACVVTGVVAMLSPKRAGRHPTAGAIYYGCLSAVFVSASLLAALRWDEDFPLFVVGTLAFLSASLGRAALRRRWRGGVRLHIACMGASYVLLLTGFYVESGAKLPLWRELPRVAYWLGPGAVGIPLIVRALLREPIPLPEPAGSTRRGARSGAEERPRVRG
jgi:uncharacterized membrane protein